MSIAPLSTGSASQLQTPNQQPANQQAPVAQQAPLGFFGRIAQWFRGDSSTRAAQQTTQNLQTQVVPQHQAGSTAATSGPGGAPVTPLQNRTVQNATGSRPGKAERTANRETAEKLIPLMKELRKDAVAALKKSGLTNAQMEAAQKNPQSRSQLTTTQQTLLRDAEIAQAGLKEAKQVAETGRKDLSSTLRMLQGSSNGDTAPSMSLDEFLADDTGIDRSPDSVTPDAVEAFINEHPADEAGTELDASVEQHGALGAAPAGEQSDMLEQIQSNRGADIPLASALQPQLTTVSADAQEPAALPDTVTEHAPVATTVQEQANERIEAQIDETLSTEETGPTNSLEQAWQAALEELDANPESQEAQAAADAAFEAYAATINADDLTADEQAQIEADLQAAGAPPPMSDDAIDSLVAEARGRLKAQSSPASDNGGRVNSAPIASSTAPSTPTTDNSSHVESKPIESTATQTTRATAAAASPALDPLTQVQLRHLALIMEALTDDPMRLDDSAALLAQWGDLRAPETTTTTSTTSTTAATAPSAAPTHAAGQVLNNVLSNYINSTPPASMSIAALRTLRGELESQVDSPQHPSLSFFDELSTRLARWMTSTIPQAGTPLAAELEAFARSEHAAENVLFMREVDTFRNSQPTVEAALDLMDRFITQVDRPAPSSYETAYDTAPVFLSPAALNHINDELAYIFENPDAADTQDRLAALFDGAQAEAKSSILRDTLPRWSKDALTRQ